MLSSGLESRVDSRPLWPSRGWWVVLLVILLLGAGLRFTGYNFSLPYVDNPNESNWLVAGRMVIDFGSPKPLGMQGYPPGIIGLDYVILRLFHDPATPPASVLWIVRLIAITFSLGVLVLVGLLGYRIGTPLGGLLAAGLWAIPTILVEQNRFANADTFVAFFTLLAVFLALTGTLYDRNAWTTGSMAALMLAIVFKYQAATVLPVVLLMPLWRLRQPNVERRRIFRNLATNIGWLALFFAWLILLFPITEASQVPNWVAPSSRLSIPTPQILIDNLRHVIEPIGTLWLWIPGIAGLLLMAVLPWPELGSRFGLAMAVLCALAWHVGVSFYGDQEFRQFIGEAAFLMLLLGIGLAVGAVVLERALSRVVQLDTPRRSVWVSSGLIGVMLAVAMLPQLTNSIVNGMQHTLPDRRNDLARYMDTSLAPAPYIADDENHKTLDGAFGGYAGLNSFPRVEIANVMDRPIDEWREMGVVYAIERYELWEDMHDTDTPEGQATLDQTLLLKAYEPSREYRGPSMVVLRLYPIQHEAEGQLGPIQLIGYDIDTTQVTRGETISFTLYWQADNATDGEYAVFNHLVNSNGEMVAQIDGSPLPDERRPTTTWDDDEETFISRPFSLILPDDLAPGEYDLITGFYRRDSNERLQTADGDDSLLVATLIIAE